MMNVHGYRSRRVRALCALPFTLVTSVLVIALAAAPAPAAVLHNFVFSFNGTTTPAGSFSAAGVSVDNNPTSPSYGDVYVTDLSHKVIDRFIPSTSAATYDCQVTGAGSVTTSLSECDTSAAGPGTTSTFSSAEVDPRTGDLYIAAASGHAIYIFEPSGKYITQISLATLGANPNSVAIDASNGNVFIGAANTKTVYKTTNTGLPAAPLEPTVFETGFGGATAGALGGSGLAVDNDPLSPTHDDVYVADAVAKVVDVFDPSDGAALTTITGPAPGSPFSFAANNSNGLAGDSVSGHLYVADRGAGLVDEFAPSVGPSFGSSISTLNGTATTLGTMTPGALAVSASSGDIYVADTVNKVVDVFGPDMVVPTVAILQANPYGVATATLHGEVNPEGASLTKCYFEYDTSEYPSTSSPAHGTTEACPTSWPTGSGLKPVSADIKNLEPNTKYYFRLVAETSANIPSHSAQEHFTTLSPPIVESASSTNLTDTTARLHAEIGPMGSETTYHFEYDTREYATGEGAHGTSVPMPDVAVGAGTTGVAETVELTSLAPETTYHYRVVATNARSEVVDSHDYALTTKSAMPFVSQTLASPVEATGATLTAYVTPDYSQTNYHFEYGRTENYGTDVPSFNRDIGSGAGPVLAKEPIAGLSPDTTYHFRVVATNAAGTSYGPPQTFSTLSPEGRCPNEALRGESNPDPATGRPYSLGLPDCRAYEQVTPPFKSVGDLQPGLPSTLGGSGIERQGISSGGSPLLLKSLPILGYAGADGQLNATLYGLARGASGWTPTSLTPAASAFPVATEELASPADVAVTLWSAATPPQSINAEDFYLREADGSFRDIGPVAPPSVTAGEPHGAQSTTGELSHARVGVVGASAGLSDVVFQLESPHGVNESSYLWSGDGTVAGERTSLYEYVGIGHSGEGGDVPALVGVNNAGAQISQCGTGLGAEVGFETVATVEPRNVHRATPNGVSQDGLTIFFNAQAATLGAGNAHCNIGGEGVGPSAAQLYARIGAPGATQATVNVAGTSGCAASASCNVTSAVTYQGAAKDGSKVFFTSTQALLPGDKDATNDIYECELPGDAGATPTPLGVVNPCPSLNAVSVTGTSSGANVQSIVAVSEEGARVYYIATGVVSSTPNSQGQVAQAGQDNLYVYEPDPAHPGQQKTAFIATLPTASLIRPGEAWGPEAQITPNGEYLVFTTTADLTPDDTSSAGQVFRYDAQSGQLIRVSVGQNGFNANGNTSAYPAFLATTSLGRQTVSEDGSYVVFQSDDALTPQVQGGLHNVYEWHDGNVSLISDGTDTRDKAGLIGMDASGQNVFFTTADKLVGQDSDESVDVYDARIEGGFPAPLLPAGCKGEECQGPLSGALSQVILGSTGPAAIGNLTPGPTTFPPEEKQVAHVVVSSLKVPRPRFTGHSGEQADHVTSA